MKSYPSTLRYPNKPIRTLSALSAALRLPIEELHRLAANANSMYRDAKPIPKSDGSFRQPVDALPSLKDIHRRIKDKLLLSIEFPEYLTGSIKGRDARRNACLHIGAKVVVCEDIERFFPNTTAALVRDIWEGFFGFAPDVAELLTKLTTRFDVLPEGAITSSYLANLAFWRHEPRIRQRLRDVGISYSRFVDDITISSVSILPTERLTWAIALIYGMMRSCGFNAKRRKHEINRSCAPMIATKLVVNKRVALTVRERQAIRAAVYQLEVRCKGQVFDSIEKEINSLAGRVGRLTQLHPREGAVLKKRIAALREIAIK